MKEYLSLITLILFSIYGFGQVCPQGTKWNINSKRCEKIEVPTDMAVVNFKCPNGYSWVSFKRECLTNKKVKDIYDSLRIEYLKNPQLTPRKYEYSDNDSPYVNNDINTSIVIEEPEPVDKKSKKKKGKDDEKVAATTTNVQSTPAGSITISQEDFNELREEIISLKSEVTEIKETNQQIQQDIITFQTLIDENNVGNNSDGSETIIATVSADDINYLKSEISSFKTQVAQMQELVNTLQEQQKNVIQGSYTFDTGDQNSSVSKSEIYGQSEMKFRIECPNDYKWVNEESICLRSEIFNKRSRAKALDPNSNIDYGIRDVKCPKFFLWNSKSQNCIPTLHAAVKE